ncbi:hypothetical protein RRK80_004704 [Salmonella enterica]|nr:hypothetical protein [Salmonella enterica]
MLVELFNLSAMFVFGWGARYIFRFNNEYRMLKRLDAWRRENIRKDEKKHL